MKAKGVAFYKEWGPERVNVYVHLSSSELQITAEHGSFSLPISGIELDYGGADGKMLFVRHSSLPEATVILSDGEFISHLIQHGPRELGQKIEEVIATRRGKSLQTLGWVAVAIISVIFLGWIGRGLVESSVGLIPFSVDQKIGELADKEMASSAGVTIKEPIVLDAIDEIVERLEPHSGMEEGTFKVKVIESDQVNAYALPGGYLVVFTGLIAEADSPEEVAAVIGHEMAHVTERHGLERIVGSLGLISIVQIIFGDAAGLALAVRDLFTLAAINSYSRDQETEADITGIRILSAAQVNPRGSIAFFEKMKENQSSLEKSGLFDWVSTHPDHTQRIAELKQEISTLSVVEYKPFKMDWEQVKSTLQPQEIEKNPIP